MDVGSLVVQPLVEEPQQEGGVRAYPSNSCIAPAPPVFRGGLQLGPNASGEQA